MPRALFSVSDKSGIVDFAAELAARGWEIVASGGTEQTLRQADLPVTSVAQVTGQPEMLGGRVKTLHPAIHSGILAGDRAEDWQELAELGFAPISLVVCNLYPFGETVQDPDVSLAAALEQIDIGGAALLRAAAKNFLRVTVICDPADYAGVISAISIAGQTDLALRRELALKAFAHTRDYDQAIHAWLFDSDRPALEPDTIPDSLAVSLPRSHELRYGENPHQAAAYYPRVPNESPLGARQLGGKRLSYNNILDADGAWRAVSSFSEPTAVIVKHLNPTGIASAASIAAAFPQALASDPLSAFGGIIAVNREVDEEFVAALGSLFIEAVAAPFFSAPAIAQFRRQRKHCRLLQMPAPYDGNGLEIRSVMGGLLAQRYDRGDPQDQTMTPVTERAPLAKELTALRFAWQAVQHVKSNAIVLAQGARTVGIGGGLPSRVDAVQLAIQKAGGESQGAALASDAFFPFADGLEAAARAGVRAVIQPGGSIRDAEVIEAANDYGLAMIFTGVRHFRH